LKKKEKDGEDVAAARSALQLFLLKKKIREKIIMFACSFITPSREREGRMHLVSQEEERTAYCLFSILPSGLAGPSDLNSLLSRRNVT